MASLGTLVTIVTADTSGFQAGMNEAAKRTEDFGHKSEGGLKRFEETLKSAKKEMRSFNEILGLALGFTIGRGVFETIHEGLSRAAEGFVEAQRAGAGFWDSVGDGIRKMTGFKTATEEAAEAGEKFAKVEQAIADAMEKSRRFLTGDKGQFPLFSGAEGVDTALREAMKKAQTEAQPFHEEVRKAQDRLSTARSEGFFATGVFETELEKAQAKGKKFFEAEAGAEAALRDFEQAMEPKEAKAELDKAEENAAESMSKIIQANKEYTDALGELEKALGERLRDEMEMRDAVQQNRLKDKFALENMPAAAASADRIGMVGLAQLHEQFQNAAAGSIPAKQLKEAEKTNVNLQDLNNKIDGLDTDLKNKKGIAWA